MWFVHQAEAEEKSAAVKKTKQAVNGKEAAFGSPLRAEAAEFKPGRASTKAEGVEEGERVSKRPRVPFSKLYLAVLLFQIVSVQMSHYSLTAGLNCCEYSMERKGMFKHCGEECVGCVWGGGGGPCPNRVHACRWADPIQRAHTWQILSQVLRPKGRGEAGLKSNKSPICSVN